MPASLISLHEVKKDALRAQLQPYNLSLNPYFYGPRGHCFTSLVTKRHIG